MSVAARLGPTFGPMVVFAAATALGAVAPGHLVAERGQRGVALGRQRREALGDARDVLAQIPLPPAVLDLARGGQKGTAQ